MHPPEPNYFCVRVRLQGPGLATPYPDRFGMPTHRHVGISEFVMDWMNWAEQCFGVWWTNRWTERA